MEFKALFGKQILIFGGSVCSLHTFLIRIRNTNLLGPRVLFLLRLFSHKSKFIISLKIIRVNIS